MAEDHVFLGIPHYGEVLAESIAAVCMCTARRPPVIVTNCASLLAHNFNKLWCNALNTRKQHELTHFAMLHADVLPASFWLDTLIDEMRRVNADVMSAVVAIKDARGLTSTAVQDPKGGNIRRFTMKEIMGLPETFDVKIASVCLAGDLNKEGSEFAKEACRFEKDKAEAAAQMAWAASRKSFLDASRWQDRAEHNLCINTACWVCDFTKPWVEEVVFNIKDHIAKTDQGEFVPMVLSEDWNFSGWCAQKGLKVCATRKVVVQHFGRVAYGNDSVWGNCQTDPGDRPIEREMTNGENNGQRDKSAPEHAATRPERAAGPLARANGLLAIQGLEAAGRSDTALDEVARPYPAREGYHQQDTRVGPDQPTDEAARNDLPNEHQAGGLAAVARRGDLDCL